MSEKHHEEYVPYDAFHWDQNGIIPHDKQRISD